MAIKDWCLSVHQWACLFPIFYRIAKRDLVGEHQPFQKVYDHLVGIPEDTEQAATRRDNRVQDLQTMMLRQEFRSLLRLELGRREAEELLSRYRRGSSALREFLRFSGITKGLVNRRLLAKRLRDFVSPTGVAASGTRSYFWRNLKAGWDSRSASRPRGGFSEMAQGLARVYWGKNEAVEETAKTLLHSPLRELEPQFRSQLNALRDQPAVLHWALACGLHCHFVRLLCESMGQAAGTLDPGSALQAGKLIAEIFNANVRRSSGSAQ
jgi:hypothetical protein